MNRSKLDDSTNSIKNKQFEELISNIKVKKSKGILEDLLKPQNDTQVNQILTTEYKATT